MNNKSKFSRLTCKDVIVSKKDTVSTKEPETTFPEGQEKKISALNTTPIARRSFTREDIEDERLSPFYMRFTQDSGDDELDVVWDWDSPRTKGNRILHRKRLLHSSPKIPKKQIPSDKNLPRFNSLKAELEELANKLHDQDNDVLDSEDIFVKPKTPVTTTEIQDLFDDDSFDEEMIKCSQKVEEAHNLNKWCSSIMNNNKEYKPLEDKTRLLDTPIKDDSFDVFLEEIKDEDIQKLSQASSSSNCSQPPVLAKSKLISSPRSFSRTNSVPTEFFTKPFPISTVTSSSLVSRTKSEDTGKSDIIHCSPEEIEKKRREAKAKLEFKKKQQEIEKKRMEALERLKRNRMQKMLSQNSQKALQR